MFLCGDDSKAKELVSRICKDSGWNPIDVGSISLSHYLEAAAMIWIITAFTGGQTEAGLQKSTAIGHANKIMRELQIQVSSQSKLLEPVPEK